MAALATASSANTTAACKRPSSTPPWWLGGVASAIAACCTHPLDLIKVRMQTSALALAGTSIIIPQRPSMIGTCIQIITKESPLTLFSGLSASILRQLTYSTVRFAGYDVIIKWLNPAHDIPDSGGGGGSKKPNAPWKSLVAGVMAGALGAMAGNPADVVNVRMQSDGRLPIAERRNYRHAVDGLVRIIRQEGPLAMYRGLQANIGRSMAMTAAQVGCYDQFKQHLLHDRWLRWPYGTGDIQTHFVASLMAGLVATTASAPLDVLKTRLMSQQRLSFPLQASAGRMLADIVQKEGIAALFRGWLPAFTRLGPQTILTFIILEQLRQYFT